MSLGKIGENKCCGGMQLRYEHASSALDCNMTFSIYLPPQALDGTPVPVIYWLSGLTCTDENFVQKAGAQAHAAKHGVAVVAPDTSPRGEGVPDAAEGAYDFGLGAGFYVNATQAPWQQHYQMYSYITEELPALIEKNFPVDPARCSIMGHSMGGHGALTIALKNPGRYKAVSAFAPIASPINCPWGQKALKGYLGDDEAAWRAYDTTVLLETAQERLPLLVDQGGADSFLEEQLKPDLLRQACEKHDHPLALRLQSGYDHSYFFIATFIGDHFEHHAKALKA